MKYADGHTLGFSMSSEAPYDPVENTSTAPLDFETRVAGEVAEFESIAAQADLLHHNITRRRLFQVAIALAAWKTVSRLEDVIMDNHFGVNDTSITVTPDGHIPKPQQNAGLASPGFIGDYGGYLVSKIRDADVYPSQSPIGYYTFSSHDVTEEDIAISARKFAHGIGAQSLDLHGVSLGAIVTHLGALGAGLPLRMNTMNGSPFDIEDARHSLAAKIVAKAAEWHLYSGELLGKYLVYLVNEFENNPDNNGFWEHFTAAGTDTWEGVDPRMAGSQLVLLDKADMHNRADDFRGIITPDTHVLIIRDETPGSDPIVDDQKSADKWVDFYGKFKAQVDVIALPVTGHAPLEAGINAAKPAMLAIIDDRRD